MARRLPSLLAATTSTLVFALAGAAIAAAPSAGATGSPAPAATASSWIDTVNWYRSMAHVAPVVEEATWSDGLAKHLTYLHDTPASLNFGANASAPTENPASPAYTADGVIAGASADIFFGAAASEQATV